MGMTARIAALEESVAAGNRTAGQLEVHTSDVLSRLAVIEGMLRVVGDLKHLLRDFTKALLPHVFGENFEEDLEKQSQGAAD